MQLGTAIDGRRVPLQTALEARALEAMRIGRAVQKPKTGAAAVSQTEEAGRAFESYFATMLVREMRRAMPEGFFSGTGSDVYGAWFDEHLGAALAERDALGLAGMVKTALARRDTAFLAEKPGGTR